MSFSSRFPPEKSKHSKSVGPFMSTYSLYLRPYIKIYPTVFHHLFTFIYFINFPRLIDWETQISVWCCDEKCVEMKLIKSAEIGWQKKGKNHSYWCPGSSCQAAWCIVGDWLGWREINHRTRSLHATSKWVSEPFGRASSRDRELLHKGKHAFWQLTSGSSHVSDIWH